MATKARQKQLVLVDLELQAINNENEKRRRSSKRSCSTMSKQEVQGDVDIAKGM